MKSSVVFAACLLMLIAIYGCVRMTSPANVRTNDDSYLAQGRIQFEKSSVHRAIRVERADPQRLPSGQLKLTLTLRNKTDEDIWVEIRTTFLDKDGHVLEQTNWEVIMLDTRTVSEYTCTSMGTHACDYQVIMKKPTKSD